MKQIAPLLFAFALVVSLTPSASTQTMGQPEHFSASAIDINNGRAGTIEIEVNRWSTPAERETLVGALLAKGPDDLLKRMQDGKSVGRIHTPDDIATICCHAWCYRPSLQPGSMGTSPV